MTYWKHKQAKGKQPYLVSFPFSFCRNLAILYIPPSRGGYIIFWVGMFIFILFFPFLSPFPFTYLQQQGHPPSSHTPTTPSRPSRHGHNRHLPTSTTPSRDDTSQQIHQPAPHKYPFYLRSNRLLFPFLITLPTTHN